jgi:E3 ubiquitin-protein ligase MARCH6
MEWLSHSNKKHCELCKTPFRFTKLYDSHMPQTLPLPIFAKRACLHTLNYLSTWARAVTVALVWLIVLPWCIRWSWRGLFWILDAGWARDPWLAKIAYAAQQHNNSTAATDALADEKEPFGLSLGKFLVNSLFYPLKPLSQSASYSSSNMQSEPSFAPLYSSLLSDVKAVNNLTSHVWLNRFILDVLEGDIITINVVVAFILVFLIREWVVQQQPIINAAAHIRDAEIQLDFAERAAQRLQGLDAAALNDDDDDGDETLQPDLERYRHIFEQPLSETETSEYDDTQFIGWYAMETLMDNAGVPHQFEGEDHEQFMEAFEEASEELFEQLKLAENSGISQADIAKNIWAILDNLDPTEKDLWRESLLREAQTKYMLLSNLPDDKIALSDDEYPGGDIALPEVDSGSGTDDDSQDEQRRRPAMPPRDASSHAQRVIQSLEEPTNGLGSGGNNRVGHDGDSGSGSWQSITNSSNPESSDPTGTPSSPLPTTDHGQSYQATSSVNTTTGQHSADSRSAAPTVNSNGSSANEDIPPSPRQEIISNIFEEPAAASPAEEQPPPQQESVPQTIPLVEPRRGPISKLFDWFWADIVVEEDVNDPLAGVFDEEIVRDEANEPPFVHVHGHEHDHDFQDAQDPEVLQAAADAGLDAEAIEDAEDLEGVLELIGMQGPLAGLAQTAVFCGFLITASLWLAIGLPYFFGKITLLFLGDPITSMVMTPLRIVSMFADAIVDITVYVGGAATYFTSQLLIQLLTLLVGSVFQKVGLGYVESLSTRAHQAANGAGVRLAALFDDHGPLELGPLVKSNEARQSLLNLKAEAAQIVRFFAGCASGMLYHIQKSTAPEMLKAVVQGGGRVLEQTATSYTWVRTVLAEGLSSTAKNGTITFTVHHGGGSLDPALAIWTNEDRCLTVLAGYVFLAAIGAMYLLRKEALFSSPNLQGVEKTFADLLKQASGVLKVILIISIEMLAFPLYCGMLLDSALLPLFENASFASRLAFASRSPWLFVFLHWFIGTCYMFHFALFVSMCRRILRSGVLYFIRDPDDPTFHPVRDVLERSVTTQLRKIAFSGAVYGGLVIVCLGGAIWGTSRFGVFPIRWARPESDLEFPIDFLGYNLLAPVVATYLFPSKGMETIFGRWLKLCARSLRLSQFLFGERRKIEEGHLAGESWLSNFNPWKNQHAIVHSENFVKDGKYVRAPATDQVRIPRGDTVFLEVSETDERVNGTNTSNGIHGRQPENFVQVYIPPFFRVRILTFVALLWMFAIAMGLGITVVPMMLGRLIMSILSPQRIALNDLYNFAVGITALGVVLQSLFNGRKAAENIKHATSRENLAAVGANIKKQAWRLVQNAYVYGFAIVIVPSLFALVLELYLILPLRTYMGPSALTQKSDDITSNDMPGAHVTLANTTLTTFAESQAPQLAVASHTFHILQDWTLGFIYGRVVLRLLLLSRNSRPAAAMRAITRDGFTNPNVRLATRAFVLPTLLVFSVVLICPALIASFLDVTNLVSASVRTKVYRYSYPICASQALGIWCTWELSEGLRRWRGRIKDEVYLIGERLHNLGEKKPPEGSKSVVRRHS